MIYGDGFMVVLLGCMAFLLLYYGDYIRFHGDFMVILWVFYGDVFQLYGDFMVMLWGLMVVDVP